MKEAKKKSKKSARRGNDIDKRLDNGSVEKPANPSVRPTPFVLDAASGMGRTCAACGTLMRWGSKVISYAGKSGNHYEVHEECYPVLLSR
jgi:hypothetical protein